MRLQPSVIVSSLSHTPDGICGLNAAAMGDLVSGWWSWIMSRIVSVWLPRWPIVRFLAAQARNPSREPVDPDRPFVLAVDASGGPCIAALNAAAEAEGLAVGDRVADARAKAAMLQ